MAAGLSIMASPRTQSVKIGLHEVRKFLLLVPVVIATLACTQGSDQFNGFLTSSPERMDKVVKSEAEWKKVLTPTNTA
jgi:hypothetical protein